MIHHFLDDVAKNGRYSGLLRALTLTLALALARALTLTLALALALTRYSGFCELGIELQRCENDALRACAGLTAAQSGLMVRVRVRVRVRVTRLMVKSVHPMCPLPRPYPLPLPLPLPGQARAPNVPSA